MGALHRGHGELIRACQAKCELTVVSIFVNPTQFNNPQDFETYPKSWEEDLEFCKSRGVDVVFAPEVDTIYPPGYSTFIEVQGVSDRYEGRYRPGHFRGVATVCHQLFAYVRPNLTFFGSKDLQQVAVVRQMIRDLDMGILLKEVPTVREPSGLALSSRNRRLSTMEMLIAPALYRELSKAASILKEGTLSPDEVCLKSADALIEAGFNVEYFDIVSSMTFEKAEVGDPNAHIIVAAWLGDVRLIDNLKL